MNTGNTYYFIDDFNNIRKQKNGVKSECSEVLELQDLIDDVNNLVDENEQLKQEIMKLKGSEVQDEVECLSEESLEQFRKDLEDGKFIEFTAR